MLEYWNLVYRFSEHYVRYFGNRFDLNMSCWGQEGTYWVDFIISANLFVNIIAVNLKFVI